MKRIQSAFRHVCAWIAGALLALGTGLAQSDTAAIAGYVRDPTGAVIANAGIAIRNESTGLERRTADQRTRLLDQFRAFHRATIP
jgi:hypothetical protein